ncbi:ABC transporter ATP-binding protein [Dyella nitratireducens]|uniref:Multidrug ABC transporter ATP-binding protein n=1 Tax=Dyella nitratireducens TaxID=1849580 RepID=A0ABQ1G298_9GAMM|nr:ABC transporter ATP-binding protein [Dyella nitratireducens]GGA35220.1 multidrug ABC transporter ATP-binding protein [Dyella nitratireducens]GLQ40970.1 multidrug ABC transporter ATP-binding protein [Dyella nitratireducens]
MHTQTDVVARLCGVVKRYGHLTALDGVDLVLQRGELLAVLGPNGAGKSTSISLLLGLIRPDGGQAELFGMDPQQIDARRRIGVMLQSAVLPPTLHVGELLRLVASYYPHPRPLKESTGLAGIDDLLNRPYGRLSGGQQRRVQFALALCGRPELVFLDEPTVGMDIDARRKLWSAMRNLVAEGCSVVLTTHYLEEAEALAQRVVVMAKGRVLSEGSVDALRAQVPLARIRCATDLDVEAVSAWPLVNAAQREGGRLLILTSEPENVLRRLLDADASLSALEVQRAGLAEAFTELTREEDEQQEAA